MCAINLSCLIFQIALKIAAYMCTVFLMLPLTLLLLLQLLSLTNVSPILLLNEYGN